MEAWADDQQKDEKSETADFEVSHCVKHVLSRWSDDLVRFQLLKDAGVAQKNLVVIDLADLDALVVKHKLNRQNYHIAWV